MERNTYEDILDNFEQFCDQFAGAAAQRFSGQDNDSRQPIDNGEVQRVTPTVVREVRGVGPQDIPSINTRPGQVSNRDAIEEFGEGRRQFKETSIDVSSTEV